MPICPSPINTTPLTAPRTVENWSRAIKFTAAKSFRPKTRGEVVEIIRAAEESNSSIKWGGSFWSFMGVFVSNQVLIDTFDLSGRIPDSVVLKELPIPDSERPSLVHVKGGTKVFNVNRILHGLDPAARGGLPDEDNLKLQNPKDDNKPFRALATLGGSGGQSIAGLLATGSHGGDVERSPLADWVQAIHLIGPGGQEWWIERTNGLTVGSEGKIRQKLQEIAKKTGNQELCDGIKVRKDDDVFRSVLVSVGRMGLVYSLVIKTVPAFLLAENRYEANWETFRDKLTAAALPGYLAPNNEARKFFVQVLINPFGAIDAHKCKVSERWVIEDQSAPRPPKPPPGFDFFKWLCRTADTRSLIPLLAAFLAGLLVTLTLLNLAANALLALATTLLAIPIIGWALAAAAYAAFVALLAVIVATILAIAALAALIAYLTFAKTLTIGDLLANITALFYGLGLKDVMKALFTALLDSQFSLKPSLDVSWKIMDTYDYGEEDFCQKVDSMDIAFDATKAGGDTHLAFIGEVLKIFDDLYQRSVPLLGALALRFSQKTEALIGMTRFPFTCHVEIPMIRNFGGNGEFLNRVQQAAMARGGVPHWGQLMGTYSAGDVQRLHGQDLDRWRYVLGTLIKDGPGRTFAFSNNFTLTYDLEPRGAGLPDNCADGGPYTGITIGTLKGPGTASPLRVEGDVDIDRIDNGLTQQVTSLHGNITIKQKVDQGSHAQLTACGSVIIGEKVDQSSEAVIWAHGDVTIKQKVDQWSTANIECGGNVEIGQKVDENSHLHITAKGNVHIGQKIDQHSEATIVADGDVVIDEGIDQHATATITSLKGSILIKKAVDGNASAELHAPNGTITIGEKVAGGASVKWSAQSFSCPNPGNGVTKI